MDLKRVLSVLFAVFIGVAAECSDCNFLSPQWSYAAVNGDAAVAVNAVPAGAVRFTLDKDWKSDLDKVSGKKRQVKDKCVVYNEFSLKEDCDLGFGMGADWWFDVYLNGEKIYSTESKGNGKFPITYRNHLFSGKGKKGDNLLAIIIRRGKKSHVFSAKGLPFVTADPTAPLTVCADISKVIGKIKPMNAGTGGPVGRHGFSKSNAPTQSMKIWREMKIPYVRNHDVSLISAYGGAHVVDVHLIFPDFSKDPEDPASYDFTLTDRYMKWMQQGNSKVFYRLGSSIEHAPKKYGTKVPPDYKKWAVICEHIIRHYNEGWANGFNMNIEYWEIWNEPDLSSKAVDKKTWQGTDQQFFDFFRVAATYLKKRFPNLKIGGPAVCGVPEWSERFLAEMSRGERVPLDFFSWHSYLVTSENLWHEIRMFRNMLDRYGYKNTESILNEWNYIRSFQDITPSLITLRSIKGAAFISSSMCIGQNSPLDMMMYYDMRHRSSYNGTVDNVTGRKLKPFYSFVAWSKLAELGQQIELDTQDKHEFFGVAATDGKGKVGVLLVRYTNADKLPGDLPVTLKIKGSDLKTSKVYLLDDKHDFEDVVPFRMTADGALKFTMKANTLVYLEN